MTVTENTNRKIPQTLVPGVYIEVLYNCVSDVMDISGDIIEIGVYKGGSIYRMADNIQKYHTEKFKNRRLIGIDTFEGHPYSDPGLDPEHHPVGRFNDTSFEAVSEALSEFEFVEIIKGECGEIFKQFPADQKFCFANIDVDIAKAAMFCTEYIYPRLSVGGILIYDEYQGYGQEKLLNEFFRDKPVELTLRTGLPSNNYGLIVKKLGD